MELEQRLSEFDQKINERFSNIIDNKFPIGDGIVELNTYQKSNFKIVWLLKEAYDNADNGRGGWSLTKDILQKDNVYDEFLCNTRSKNTWYPIIYTSFGILNNFIKFDDIKDIDRNPEVALILKNIAIININKLAGNSTSNEQNIRTLFNQNKLILKEQLEITDPDIFIGCKTLHHYYYLLGLETAECLISEEGTKYYVKDKKIFIDAYHPGRIGIKRESYVNEVYINDIINIVKSVYYK